MYTPIWYAFNDLQPWNRVSGPNFSEPWSPHNKQVTWLVVTEVQNKSFGLVTQCCHYNACHLPSSITRTHVTFFTVKCEHSKFGHHPHPLCYLCVKFCFFRSLHCWASPWRKIVYSINHSLTQLIWCPGSRSFCFRITQGVVHILQVTENTLTSHHNFVEPLAVHRWSNTVWWVAVAIAQEYVVLRVDRVPWAEARNCRCATVSQNSYWLCCYRSPLHLEAFFRVIPSQKPRVPC